MSVCAVFLDLKFRSGMKYVVIILKRLSEMRHRFVEGVSIRPLFRLSNRVIFVINVEIRDSMLSDPI